MRSNVITHLGSRLRHQAVRGGAGMTDDQGLLKIALDELRMQMLGAQLLFGFQFNALFQERFPLQSALDRWASAAGFMFIVATCALLIAAPSIHRLALHGEEPQTMRRYSRALAGAALAALTFALASDIFLVTRSHLGTRIAALCATMTALVCAFAWFGAGPKLPRPPPALRSSSMTT